MIQGPAAANRNQPLHADSDSDRGIELLSELDIIVMV